MNKQTNRSMYPLHKLILTLFLALATPLGLGFAQETAGEDVVLEAGETSVTLDEFNERFSLAARSIAAQQGLPFNEQTQALFNQLRPQFLEQLANEQALLQEAENRGISVTDEEVAQRVEEVRAGFENEDAFNQFLTEAGFEDEAEFSEFVREQETIGRVTQELSQDIEVTDEQIQTFYDENQEQIGQPLEEVRDQVRTQLEREELNRRITDLRETADVTTYPEAVGVEEGMTGVGGETTTGGEETETTDEETTGEETTDEETTGDEGATDEEGTDEDQ